MTQISIPTSPTTPSNCEQKQIYTFDFLVEAAENKTMVDVCIDVLRHANEFSNSEKYYDWFVHSDANTLTTDTSSRQRRTLVLFGDINQRWVVPQSKTTKLHHEMQQSQRVILVGGAVFIPKQLNIFSNHNLVIHPNYTAAAREEYLPVDKTQAPFMHAGKLKSAISGIAALSLLVETVSEDLGTYTGIMISEYLGLTPPTKDYLSKGGWKYIKRARGDRLISSSLKLMGQNIETPLKVCKIAETIGVSTRQMERQFQKKINETPLRAYRDIRLEYANQLIMFTDMPIPEISLASGFTNSANFSRRYKQKYKICAVEARNRAYGMPQLN